MEFHPQLRFMEEKKILEKEKKRPAPRLFPTPNRARPLRRSVGVGRFAGRREEAFPVWKAAIPATRKCPTSWSSSAGLRCACSGTISICGQTRRRRNNAQPRGALYRNLHRGLWGEPRDVRKQFSAGKGQCSYQVIFNAFKRSVRIQRGREDRAVFEDATEVYRSGLADFIWACPVADRVAGRLR